MEKPDHAKKIAGIATALSVWRQGDCAIGEHWFPYRAALDFPITDAAKIAAEHKIDMPEVQVEGFVVLSQTCDILRNIIDRPYLEVAPLVKIEDQVKLSNIKKGRYPGYAFIPGLENVGLVADLDRTTTIEKPIAANWTRVIGCRNDKEIRSFAWSLSRKRSRFAFPDDYVYMMSKLRERFTEKHDKSSAEGRALRELEEVRVRALPNWDAAQVDLYYWFIRKIDMPNLDGKTWAQHLESWEPLLKAEGRFRNEGAVIVTKHDLSAFEYLNSESLELEHISMAASA